MRNKLLILAVFLISCNLYAEEKAEVIKLEKGTIYSNPKFIENIRDSVSASYVIDAETIEKRKYNNVGEILKDIPGVNLIGNDLDMRGHGSGNGVMSSLNYNSKPQIYVDGVLQNYSDTYTSELTVPVYTVNIKDVEKIEVIPGGEAVLYGDGAVNGVIKITTKKYSGSHGRVEHRYGSYKNHVTDLGIGTSLGKVDFNLSYRKNKTAGYDKYFKNNTDFFSGQVIYNINKTDNFSLQYNLHKEKLLNSNIQNTWVQKGNDWESIPNKLIKLKDIKKKNEIVFKYTNELNKNNKLDILAFYQDLKTVNYTDTFSLKGELEEQLNTLYGDKKLGINLKNKFLYGNGSNIIVGTSYLNDKMNVTTDGVGKKINKNTISIFTLNNYKWGKLNFSQGLRYEKVIYDGTNREIKIRDNVNNWHGNLGINYLYSDTGNIYTKYEIGMTSPSPQYKFDFPIKNGNYKTEVNDLKSEITDTFEIGWNDYLLNSLISADIYYSSSKDLIKYIKEKDGSIYLKNVGETRRYGFDLKAEQKLDKITFRESYSYINAKIMKDSNKELNYVDAKNWLFPIGEREGRYIANVPTHKYTLAIDYEITKKLNLTVETAYNSDAYIRNDNTQKKGRNIVVNFRANYRPVESLDIYAGINNLYNRDHSYGGYGNLMGSAKYYTVSPKRNYYVGFSWRF